MVYRMNGYRFDDPDLYDDLELGDDNNPLYRRSESDFNSRMLPGYAEAQRDFGYRSPICDNSSTVIPVALPERGAIDNDVELAKSNFLRSEKAGYETGSIDKQYLSGAGDTMTALFRKNYGYTPSAGELIQYANLNGLRSAHQLDMNRMISSPSLDKLHQIDISPGQIQDFQNKNSEVFQKRREVALNDPLINWSLTRGTQDERKSNKYFQLAAEAADRRPTIENAMRLGYNVEPIDVRGKSPEPVNCVRKAITAGLGVGGGVLGAIEGGAVAGLGGALIVTPDPTTVSKWIGFPMAAMGGATVAKNVGDIGVNGTNLYRALRCKPGDLDKDYLPGSALEYGAKKLGFSERDQNIADNIDTLWNVASGNGVNIPMKMWRNPKISALCSFAS